MIPFLVAPFLAALAPLILPLGRNFEYEYVTLNAYAALILIPCFALWASPLSSWKQRGLVFLLAPLLNILPGLVFFALALCPCSAGEFYSFWLLQSLPHLLLGLAAGAWIEAGRRQGFRRLTLLGIFSGLGFLLFLRIALRLWLEPQKRSTDLLAGFLHGAIYDNWIPLDPGILWARGAHAALAISLLLLILLPKKSWKYSGFVLFLTASLLSQWQAGSWPSQTHGLKALVAAMPESRSGPGFTLHFNNRPNDLPYASRLEDLFQSASFHSQDLMRLLDVADPGVHIFVYPSRETKKLWFGGDGTDITDVVTPSIHITLETWPHPTLRHELVHAISSRFAYHGLGFHPNMAFTEGLAVALAPTEEDISLHEGAADIIQNKRLGEVEHLFSPLFWSESGRRAYTVAGSLILYLLEHGGLTKVKALYAGGSWESVFGQSASSLISDWKNFLAKDYTRESRSLNAEALYRYPGILQDLCPHSKSSLIKSNGPFLLSARQPRHWEPGRDYWPWRVQLTKDPGAEINWLQQRFKAKPEGEARELFAKDLQMKLQKPPKIQEDVEIFLLNFDYLISQKQLEIARQEIEEFIHITQHMRLSDDLTRQLWVRFLLLRDSPMERSDAWFKLLGGLERNLPRKLADNASWIEAYLFMRNKGFEDLPDDAWKKLIASTPPAGLPLTFTIEWWKILGAKFLQRGDLQQTMAMYSRALEVAPEGSRASFMLMVNELAYRNEQKGKTPVH